jgi:hypothetical protein
VLFIAMRYVRGGDVRSLVRREGPMARLSAGGPRVSAPQRASADEYEFAITYVFHVGNAPTLELDVVHEGHRGHGRDRAARPPRLR